jgi:hypothetical protein
LDFAAAIASTPKFVLALVLSTAPVPPFATATVPVTFVALVALVAVVAVVADVAFPERLAVIVPAEKLPDASRFTIVEPVFALVAACVAS